MCSTISMTDVIQVLWYGVSQYPRWRLDDDNSAEQILRFLQRCVAKCCEVDLGIETSELPVIDSLEASTRLLDVDVVSDQQSS